MNDSDRKTILRAFDGPTDPAARDRHYLNIVLAFGCLIVWTLMLMARLS